MNRTELTERIAKRLTTDPWDQDYSYADPIDIDTATNLIQDLRRDDELADLSDDERLPDDATPGLVMEVMNCLIRKAKHDRKIEELAAMLTVAEEVQIHNALRDRYAPNTPEIIPTEIFTLVSDFPFTVRFPAGLSFMDFIEIGMNSTKTCDFSKEYCWFDEDKLQMFSSDTPFADGIIDGTALATYIIESNDPALWDAVRENANRNPGAYERYLTNE